MLTDQPDEKLTEMRGDRSPADTPTLLARTLRGRFVLEQALGRGGMSTVYKALDLTKQAHRDPQPYVAVKILSDAMIRENPKAVMAMQREASRTQQLSHDNIVKVWDFDSEGETHFILMEWLQGQSLDAMLKARPRGLPKQQALWLLEQLCSGLSYAHERGLVHSDLKPGNVFVNAEGVLKILDFGIATPLRGLDATAPGTLYDPRQQTMRALTPSHASPEQWHSVPADPRDDVYSLGCIAYELFSGQHPFGGADALKASASGMSVAPLSTLTPAQNAALRRALSFKRADRTASAAAFLETMLQTAGAGSRRTASAILVGLAGVAAIYALVHFRGSSPQEGRQTPTAKVSAERQETASEAASGAAAKKAEAERKEAEALADKQAADAKRASEVIAAKEAAARTAEAEQKEAERVAALAGRKAAQEQAAKEAADKKAAAEITAKAAAARKAAADQADREKAAEIERLAGTMIEIPAGEFQMGDRAGDGDSDEQPAHPVRIKAFRLGQKDVTFAQYDEYARALSRALPSDEGWGRGQRPVINVTWQDAQAFIAWLNERTGQRFRLPSEAEWEYAARAGTTTRYPWGSDFDAKRANGNSTVGKTTEVGQYPANAFGLYDMGGNVWQWTQDCYNRSYSGAPSDGSAWTAGDCARRVLRGGSWYDRPSDLRASFRLRYVAAGRASGVGFRLAQDK